MKKRKNQSNESSRRNTLKTDINFPKNEEVTFGAAIRNGSMITFGGPSHPSMRSNRSTSNDSQRGSITGHRNITTSLSANLNGEEIGVVKNNPLLNHFPILSDNSGFMSDMSNSNSEFDDDHPKSLERIKTLQQQNQQTSAIVHPLSFHQPQNELSEIDGRIEHEMMNSIPSTLQENECIPEENLSITEDMTVEDKLENMKAIVNGTMRRKLYFNPAYFEPHLLMSPPPAAIEFLTKIREVITIAKYKMSTKKYQPCLNAINEEIPIGHEIYNSAVAASSRQGSVISLKRENARHQSSCTGCPGCENAKACETQNCKNCGDKRNTIRKWLEGVSANDNENLSDTDRIESVKPIEKEETLGTIIKKKFSSLHSDTSSSSDSDTIKANSVRSKRSNKGKAPPIPSSAPKIVSTSLKADMPKTENLEIYEKLDPNNLYNRNSLQTTDLSRNKIYDKSELYAKLSKSGSEIYNNPQFQDGSPVLSHRSKKSIHSYKSTRSSRKHIEVLDQYANPNATLDRKHYEMVLNLHKMPDMVYEALAMDVQKMNSLRNQRRLNQLQLPPPDYNTSEDEHYKSLDRYRKTGFNRDSDDDPFVPTPDYGSYGRNPKKPDSPIYSRKSPQYLIVDYETDSLERISSRKSLTPSSSDISSSQPSPSLSTALPMEEAVEIRNAVYDSVKGFRKDTESMRKRDPVQEDRDYSLISEIFIKNSGTTQRKPIKTPVIKYNTPFEGSLSIEVDHSPNECDISTDSDQFEPDTLDRKPKKNFKPKIIEDAWSKHLIKSAEFLNQKDDKVRYSSLENMTSLPDVNSIDAKSFRKTPGSFKSESVRITSTIVDSIDHRSFGSLREIYEAKNQKNLQRPALNVKTFEDEEGRILTLDARHSKRQRQTMAEGTLKKLMPPDVVPINQNLNNLYDNPKQPPVRIEGLVKLQPPKNLPGWSTDDLVRQHYQHYHQPQQQSHVCEKNDDNDDDDSYSSHSSESTGFTGVSDTQHNSESEKMGSMHIGFKDYSKIIRKNSPVISEKNGCFINEMENTDESYGILENFITLGDVKSNHHLPEDLDKIEVISTRSLSNHDLNETKVFRVEINPSTHGMQIALGLRDRVKKSKDLKNAWRRFVSIATSKFKSDSGKTESDYYDKSSVLSDNADEGISSLPDEKCIQNVESRLSPRSEMDSGYMSADSNESRITGKRLYEKYNFQAIRDKNNIYDVIEDKDDGVENTEKDLKELTPPPPPRVTLAQQKMPAQNFVLEIKDAIDVNVYSSDDERYSSGLSSESEDEFNPDDVCGSGAESVETHSVLFKNVRKVV